MNLSVAKTPHQSFGQVFQEMRDRIHFQTMKEASAYTALAEGKAVVALSSCVMECSRWSTVSRKILAGRKKF